MAKQESMPLLKHHEPDTELLTGVNEIIDAVNNLARAIETMAYWLVQAQTGFNAHDANGIVKIVRGETPNASS